MTCSTCTCHEILDFVVFLPKFMLFQIDYHRRHVGKPSSSSYRQAFAIMALLLLFLFIFTNSSRNLLILS